MKQLRNLVNRRNVRQNTSGRFNASLDFFELITKSHIVVAALTFFRMTNLDSVPTLNSLPSAIQKWSKARQWSYFSDLIGRLIDCYVIVRQFASLALNTRSSSTSTTSANGPVTSCFFMSIRQSTHKKNIK